MSNQIDASSPAAPTQAHAGASAPSDARTPTEGVLARLVDEIGRIAETSAGLDGEPFSSMDQVVDLLALLDEDQRKAVLHATGDLCSTLLVLLARATGTGFRGASGDITTLLRRLRVSIEMLTGLEANADVSVHYGLMDAARLVRDTAAAFLPLAQRRGIAFTIETPPHLDAEIDPRRFERAVLNLLFNAFKHTPAGGAISCALRTHPRKPAIAVRVADTGPGIPASQVGRLFDRSRQVERNVFVQSNGVQLNLGLTNDTIRLHGGTVRVFRTPSGGAGFEASLPRFAPDGFSRGAAPIPDGALRATVAEVASHELDEEAQIGGEQPASDRPTILIVEDDRSLHRLLCDYLRDEYTVVSAFDGQSGVDFALSVRPDLVVTDLLLPGISGDQLVRRLQHEPTTRQIPIVVLLDPEHGERSVNLLELGARDVLRKPFLMPEVHARVKHLVATKRATDLLNTTIGRREADLVKLAEEVAQQQQRLTQAMDDLDRARAGTETASMVKTNFLRVMSHELKTPITAVQLHVRALEHDNEIHPSPKLKDGLARIGRSSRRLATLVETALQWARIESGDARLTVTEVALRPIVEDIVGELKTYADHKSITLRVDGEPEPLHSDARLLRLLLHNVIERAIQVTDEGGVRIALSTGPAGLVVAVDDASPPIAPGQEQELFDPLPVADLHRRGGTGSGLGLHVVRDVARALGGVVALAPKASGNTLTITLPPALVPRRAGG